MNARLAAALALLLASAASAQPTFRFLTQDLPDGTTNAEYAQQLRTANAAGPVTFSVASGTLHSGLTLDPATGRILGRPTSSSNESLTFEANDGTTTIQLATTLNVSSSGGGGNGGLGFGTGALPNGRVGTAYAHGLTLQNATGPVVYGASDLPTGLTLDGSTGAITGTPIAAGTFTVLISGTDRGDGDNKAFTLKRLVVLPESHDFGFATALLDNGEVGSVHADQVLVQNAQGNVRYSASGLPPGIAIDSRTGALSGTPTTAGTFSPFLSARDARATITMTTTMIIVEGPSGNLFWDYLGLPIASAGIAYGRQPPIALVTANGTSVGYGASGLPTGITYNTSTGELSGTTDAIGVHPVTFTATDGATSEQLEFSFDFYVLPATGGSTNDLPTALWPKKMKVKSGNPGRDAWQATFLYNADRTTGEAFDPMAEDLRIVLGGRTIDVPAGSFVDEGGRFRFRTPRGEVPALDVRVDPAKQTLTLKTKGDTIVDGTGTLLRTAVDLGSAAYRMDGAIDDRGTFRPTASFRKVAMVLTRARATASGSDTLDLRFSLADPAFAFDPQTTTIQFRLLDDGTPLVTKDMTGLVTAQVRTDRNGLQSYKLQGVRESAESNALAGFQYQSAKGTGKLRLTGVDLSSLAAVTERHLTIELLVDGRSYRTHATLFADGRGGFDLAPPR